MKTKRNILIAFLLNLTFAVIEYVGGVFTGSVAIISDAIHDLGDALSIGISYFLEKKSEQKPDNTYTYGYVRFSVMGGVIVMAILIAGSVLVIYNAVGRILNPQPINYSGMIYFAVGGVVLNFIAAWVTREGDSINQKAVNLHMLEDVMGWVVVLIGAIVMKFTDISIIDPIMSIGVSVFVLFNALKGLKTIADLFLEKVPSDVSVEEITEHVKAIEGIEDVHHIHVWSMDGYNKYATMHIVTDAESYVIKQKVREELEEHGITHVTLELESRGEECREINCHGHERHSEHCSHHHHHHH